MCWNIETKVWVLFSLCSVDWRLIYIGSSMSCGRWLLGNDEHDSLEVAFMDTPENKKLSEIVDVVKLWMPRKTEAQVSVSRDFWMPDQSCRVCYECDSQFTVFNRRHHCRLCGRVFCAKCASNSIPVSNEEPKAGQEDGDRIRVCSFCFKKWQQGLATVDSRMNLPCPGLSPSPSTTSLASSQSGCTCNSGSSGSSTVYPTGPYQYVPCSSCQSASQSAQLGQAALQQDQATSMGNPEFSHFISCYRYP